jgi:3-dehydrosphinganine reductase
LDGFTVLAVPGEVSEMNISDKCAIVTGGSSGIGKGIAKILARCGANVFLVARREDVLKPALEEVRREAAGPSQRFGCFSGDVADPTAVKEAVQRAEAECGPIAVLINSAGVPNTGYVEELSISSMENTIKVNYLGSVYMIKQVLGGMIQRREGWIMNVSSLGGIKGIYGYSAYSASKFAVIGFSEALRSEIRPHGIHVSVLCPPDVDTPMLAESSRRKPLETMRISGEAKLMTADDVAHIAVRDLEKGKFLIIPNLPGKLLYIANRLLPSLLDKYLDGVIDKVRKQRGL